MEYGERQTFEFNLGIEEEWAHKPWVTLGPVHASMTTQHPVVSKYGVVDEIREMKSDTRVVEYSVVGRGVRSEGAAVRRLENIADSTDRRQIQFWNTAPFMDPRADTVYGIEVNGKMMYSTEEPPQISVVERSY